MNSGQWVVSDWEGLIKTSINLALANNEHTSKINELENKVVERLIDAPEDELRALGFTDNALRELRGLKQAGDDLAIDKRDRDMLIEELWKKTT